MESLIDPTVRSRLAEIGQDAFPRELQAPETLGEWRKASPNKSAAIKAE